MKLIPASLATKVTRTAARSILKAKKNSPHIFFAVGVVGTVGSTVLACRATLKLDKTADEIKTDLENIKIMKANSKTYSDQEYYKDLGYVYAKSTAKLGKLYGPSIIVGTVSIAALTGSHIQLTKRNSALTAAFVAVSKAFDEYRIRVREEVGEVRERELYRAISDLELKKHEGKKELVKAVDPNGLSMYSRAFEYGNRNWQKDPELNRIFIQMNQNHANHLLHARGHVLLNDVYDALGLERSQAGAVVGWVRNGNGDGFIDFGLIEAGNAESKTQDGTIWLDFNVDGVVYDLI